MSICTRVTAGPYKKHHCNEENCRDRLSNLPEGVLGNILSCLPTKDATRTCVLSKDWKLKWTLMHNVDLILLKDYPEEEEVENFFKTVKRVLSHLKVVRGLSLRCNNCGVSGTGCMIPWISSILGRNIENLVLGLFDDDHFTTLPPSILMCSNVKNMILEYTMLRVPARTCFLILKHLTLLHIDIVNDNSKTDTITFTLPLLETLELNMCKWVNMKFVEIEAPSLTTFSSSSELELKEGEDYYSIKVVGAMLSKFEATAYCYPENIILTGSTVVKASLGCYLQLLPQDFPLQKCGLQLQQLLRELSDVKCLKIGHPQPILGITKLGLPLPRFHKLEELVLSSDRINFVFDAEGLLELLHAAPFLKCLDVIMDKDDHDYESIESSPTCVVNQLEHVMVKYTSECTEPTFGLEKFLLKNGLQLKTISISALSKSGERVFSRESEIMEQLSTFPKCSTRLTICHAVGDE